MLFVLLGRHSRRVMHKAELALTLLKPVMGFAATLLDIAVIGELGIEG